MGTNSLWEMYFSNNFSKISLFVLFPNWLHVWNDAHIHNILKMNLKVFYKLYTLRQLYSIDYPLLDPFFIAIDYILCRKMGALLSAILGFKIVCYKCPHPHERHTILLFFLVFLNSKPVRGDTADFSLKFNKECYLFLKYCMFWLDLFWFGVVLPIFML